MTPAALDALEQIDIDFPPATQALAIEYVPRDIIEPDPEQPRQEADAELRASIARNGILQPITVREIAVGRYRIVDGERRWRGAEGILERIPCVVREDQEDRAERLRTQLVANTGKALAPLEEARAFHELLARHASIASLAAALGRPQSSVAERLQLLELGPWLAWLEVGRITVSHAVRALLPYRGCPDDVHAHVMARAEKDYRMTWTETAGPVNLRDFASVVEQSYRPHLYPLARTKASYDPQPEFDTRRHDEECTCGGILVTVAIGDRKKRKHCGNPAWWRPRHKKALAAKPKAKPQANGSRARVSFELPKGTATVSAGYDAPKGIVALTNFNGQWNVETRGDDEGAGFDPATLTIDPSKLVLLKGAGGVPRVGTRDLAAVRQAREAWRARWAARRDQLLAPMVKAFGAQRAAYRVAGPGLPEIVGLLSLAGEMHDVVRDAVALAGLALPERVTKATSGWQAREAMAKWTASLEEKEASALTTALAFMRGTRAVAPTVRVAKEIAAEVATIRKRPIPWAKQDGAAKGKKSAAVDNADREDLPEDADVEELWSEEEEED